MVYLTSWDANVFLCLLTYLPEDVVKGMIGCVKKTHEEFSLKEAKEYWETNSPELVRFENGETLISLRFHISNLLGFTQTRINMYNRRLKNTIEFKREWKLRSIADRHKKVVDWCKFGDDTERLRHQGRLRITNPSNSYSNSYTRNLWATWEAIASSYYFVGWERRVNASQWYEGIHPGRFFLFFQKNKIIEERFRGVPKGPCEDGYRYPPTPIFAKGPYEQLIEDLRCLDGGGLGEPVGKKVEHIDDIFS